MSEKAKKSSKRGVKEDLAIVPIPTVEVAVTENKYWIKNGIAVSHVDYPGVKMRVQEVRKFTKKLDSGNGEKRDVTFIKGVVCTWLDTGHKFQKGIFHTRELVEWKAKD